jgi:hypothetical protein
MQEASLSERKEKRYDCLCAACAADGFNSLLSAKIVNIVGQTLLTAVSEGARAQPPFYLESVVLDAIYRLLGEGTREENMKLLWTQVCHPCSSCEGLRALPI